MVSERNIGEVLGAEYPSEPEDALVLHQGGSLVVGQRLRYRDFPELTLDYGKQRPYATVGRTGPWGIDAMTDFRHESSGATRVQFRDGITARAIIGDISSVACGCIAQAAGVGQCRHAMAALILAAGAEDVVIPDFNGVFHDEERALRTQLAGAIDTYLESPHDPMLLLRAADAGYVYLRGVRAVRLGPLAPTAPEAHAWGLPIAEVLFA